MTTFAETNGVIHNTNRDPMQRGYYAACEATGCTWVGPYRDTIGAAKRDAVAHHDDDEAY